MITIHVYRDQDRLHWIGKFNLPDANLNSQYDFNRVTSEATRRFGLEWKLLDEPTNKWAHIRTGQ